jgi:teichuronic acid biosynthesis glycosyltransferase TuaC
MRLLFLSNEFPNRCERSKATFNQDLLTALARDHEVTVISPIAWWDELRTRCRHPFRPWLRTRQVGRLVVHHPRFYYTPGRLRHWYGSFLWWSLRATVSRILRGPQPDCVLSYWAHPDGEAAVRLAQTLGVPSVVMVGGSDVLLLTRDPRRKRCIRRVLQQADAVVAVSRDLANKVVELGVAADRVHVLRRGVDGAVFSPGDRGAARKTLGLPADRRLLLWVGRMVPVKGLDTLLAACDLLRQRGSDFHLCLVGDGPLRPALAAEVRKRGLSGHVTFAGSVAHHQLSPWFQAADLTVLPSRSEGIPNVLLESLACGTPFVASAVGGVPEIAGHAAARLVPPDRPDELAAALAWALANRSEVAESDRPHTLQQFAQRVADLARELQCPATRPEEVPADRSQVVLAPFEK